MVVCSRLIFDSAWYYDIVLGWHHMPQQWLSHSLPQRWYKIISSLIGCLARNLSASSAQILMWCRHRYWRFLMYHFDMILGWTVTCTWVIKEAHKYFSYAVVIWSISLCEQWIPLQRVMNAAAYTIMDLSVCDHMKSVEATTLAASSQYTLCLLMHLIHIGQASQYLRNCVSAVSAAGSKYSLRLTNMVDNVLQRNQIWRAWFQLL